MTGSVSAGGSGVDLTPFPVAGMTHNKDELRTRLLNQVESALYYLFPNGKRRGARFVVGNVQGDAGESLVIEIEGAKRGVWFDFATGESGDVLALWAAVRGFTLPGQFGELLDDLAGWLLVPRANAVAVEFKPSGAPVQDALGAVTGKWEYRSADGDLLAYVYRYDTRQGKQYRPWDVKAHAMRMPAIRPLYNLPEMASAEVVVLVEGEKCAQALIEVGVVATTAMGGASAGIDKTDWLPLSGKTVVIWPDHDAVGAKYAHAVTRRLCSMGVTVRAVRIPKDKPPKWDAADAVDEGFDIDSLLRAATAPQNDGGEIATPAEAPKRFDISQWHAVERFVGKPKARRWLVAGVFPMAQAALVAAGGGVGKSFLLLSLAREVAVPDGTFINAPVLFGSSLAEHGVAIYITAEDDAIEVHNRLNALGSIPERLYVLPLPDAGGAQALFAPDSPSRGPGATKAWAELESQLKAMVDLRLVVLDPLQPLCALDLNVPENAQFVCSKLAALAASTGASVIVSHHFAKREATNPEQAREAIRGTGGLVDGVRSVYALWNPKEDSAKNICKLLGQQYQRGGVVMGAVVKANGRAYLNITTFLRDKRGLLVDRTAEVSRLRPADLDLRPELKAAITRAAAEGRPYTKSGGNGVYERRHELPEAFHALGKHRLAEWVTTLLANGELVGAIAEGSRLVKWLDVPTGPVASGHAAFAVGHQRRSAPSAEPAE